jgi:hypothetical protein
VNIKTFAAKNFLIGIESIAVRKLNFPVRVWVDSCKEMGKFLVGSWGISYRKLGDSL